MPITIKVNTNGSLMISAADAPSVLLTNADGTVIPLPEGKNVFLVRCDVEGTPEGWWKPGMSGVCKLNVGDRRLIWIITHRTVDFLRMWFWW